MAEARSIVDGKVTWSKQALEQIDVIVGYIELFDPVAADKLAQRLLEAGESLHAFPNRGRPVGDGVRELVNVRPYIIQYEVVSDAVSILGVRHSAQLRNN